MVLAAYIQPHFVRFDVWYHLNPDTFIYYLFYYYIPLHCNYTQLLMRTLRTLLP